MRVRLEEERERLAQQLKQMTEARKLNPDQIQVKWDDVGSKDEDNAVEVANFQDELSLEKNLEKALEKVNLSLKKIEAGTYGICEQCGKDIEERRLEAYPAATICMRHSVQNGGV